MAKSRVAILVGTAGLMAMGGTAGDRGAASPSARTFCIQWRDFCDKAQISTDDHGNTYGLWDWACNGVDLTSGLGRALKRLGFETLAPDPPSFGTRPVAGGVPFGLTLGLVFNTSGRISTLWGTDGLEPPFTVNQDAPWTATEGPCDFSAVTDKPRMVDAGVRSSGRVAPVATATSANGGAAWPDGRMFCVQWRDFCDQAQISTDDRGNTHGLWDWTCNGVDLTSGLGRALNPAGFEVLVPDPPSFGTRPVAGGQPLAFTMNLVFDLSGRVSTLWATDGTSAPFPFTQDAAWTAAEGTCDFSAVTHKPPLAGRRR